ncbi:serine hydrolase domain-containing protein [Urechidicola croceus]|uniref:Beta-lactamase-related domain-containing protein n=1 Tax=Urechidicola croceus TaxID=1850246 RepID=A0A1D8P3Q9_9FLAO|nr:serine hydrolase [Urechidicola croceus]AOW19209.1 hypothetical protein LPB138_00250 [Urechidicola croceus]
MLFFKKFVNLLLYFFIFFSLVFCESKKDIQSTATFIDLTRATPESQGVTSESISNFIDELKKSDINFHSLMIVKNGNVIAEGWWDPYKPEYKHQLYSLSKAFTSTAIGFAVQEKLLTVEDQVISFFPNQLPTEISENLASLKIKHLLTMSLGQEEEPMNMVRNNPENTWVKSILSQPFVRKPGSKFKYTSACTFLLSAIIQKVTNEKLHDYLKPRLFEPLNINNSDWMENPEGINTGGYGLRIKTEDIAKLGQLYLNKGEWNGKQIISEKWVTEATTKQIESSAGDGDFTAYNDWSQGYGYKFWLNTVGGYRADGAYGQFSIVIPEKNLVVAITEESFSMGDSMELIWKYLIPYMDEKENLKENPIALENLNKKLENLEFCPPKTISNSVVIPNINRKEYALNTNQFDTKSVQFDFSNEACTLVVTEKSDEQLVIDFGFKKWITETNEKKIADSFFPVPGRIDFSSKIAGFAHWEDEKTLILTSRFLENVHGDKMICTFEDNNLTIEFLNSEAQGKNIADPRPIISGEF